MSILNVENLSHGFGDRVVFDVRVGYLDQHGCGKQGMGLQ